MDNTILWLWLHETVCVSRIKEQKLIEHFGSIERVYKAKLSDFVEMGIFKDDELNRLANKDTEPCHVSLGLTEKLGARVVTIDSPLYPELLKNIPDPPFVLYMRGKFVDLNKHLTIAMVGTRKATLYGKQTAYNLARELSHEGAVVVSGLALGIDAKSHEGALSANAPTVAVIGCGVDIAYPKTNAPLMKEILKSGMVISEYPLGTLPEKYHFPERNRIISGLCLGTLVVEANFKSGSLITAKAATEQNRDVFAVPGNINSITSKGSNYLLKDGAHLVTCAEDVISYYRFDYPHLLSNRFYEAESLTQEVCPADFTVQDIILNAIGEGTAHTDSICEKTGMDIGSVNANLLMLELGGKVIKLAGGYYSRTK